MHATVWSLRQRLLVAVMTLLAAGTWWLMAGPLQAADGGQGLTLSASRAGIAGVLLVAIAGGIATALGAVVAAMGSHLQGLFVVTASLTLLAGGTGPIDDWLLRSGGPGGFLLLAFETLVWVVLMLPGWLGLVYLRRQLIRRFNLLEQHEAIVAQRLLMLEIPSWQALAAGAITAAIGGILSLLMIRSSDTGQVICSLLLAFAAGAGVAHSLLPSRQVLPTLLVPMVVAVLAYAHVAYHFDTHAAVLHGWFNMNGDLPFNDRMPGPALALPIDYAGAGVTGCLLGLGIARGMRHQVQRHGEDDNTDAPAIRQA